MFPPIRVPMAPAHASCNKKPSVPGAREGALLEFRQEALINYKLHWVMHEPKLTTPTEDFNTVSNVGRG
uniref:hypothetical protein n=1 Tax=Vaginimicrobium propionicum TaxID=1871034 RepID=UPI000970707E|nr:hypothetical protein [Vaginimicrobium propionicum]